MTTSGFIEDQAGSRGTAPLKTKQSAKISNQHGTNGAAFVQTAHNAYFHYEGAIGAGLKKAEYVAFDLGRKYYGRFRPDYVLKLDATAEDAGVWTDVTSAINAGTATQVFPTAEAQYDAMYIGFASFAPTGIVLDVSVAGVDAGTVNATWEYPTAVTAATGIPTAAGWTTLGTATAYTLEDNTDTAPATGLKPFIPGAGAATGYTIQWVLPEKDPNSMGIETATAWRQATIQGKTAYWIKVMVNAAGYTTEPKVTNIYGVPALPALSATFIPTANATLYVNGERTATDDAVPVSTAGKLLDEYEIHQLYWTQANAGDDADLDVTTRR